jgi:peptidoglycan hydrolase-like protein with peptidoglycan-binding domain
MSKYFDYSATEEDPVEFGHRTLKYDDLGDDVKQLQASLITLGYSCGKWGADGEFGSATRNAVKAFQSDHDLSTNGIADDAVFAAINKLLPEDSEEAPEPESPVSKTVEIINGNAWVRTQPNTSGAKLGVVKIGDKLPYGGEVSESGWLSVMLDSEEGWVSNKYAHVI